MKKKKLQLLFLLLSLVLAIVIPCSAYAIDNATEEPEEITIEKEIDPYSWVTITQKRRLSKASSSTSTAAYTDCYGDELTEDQKQFYSAFVERYIDRDNDSLSKKDIEWDTVWDAETESYKTVTSYDFTTVVDPTTIAEAANTLMNNVSYAYWAFVYDYPTAFWAGSMNESLSYYSDGTINLTLNIQETYPGAKDAVDTYNAGVKEAVQAITNSVPSISSEYDYYRAIHDWICENLAYHYPAVDEPDKYPEAYSSGNVFAGERLVTCEGYGEAYKVLCDVLQAETENDQIKAVEVVGVTNKGVSHMWNYVQMSDGNWYAMDALWDDQDTICDTYFLCGSQSYVLYGNTFAQDHIESNYFTSKGEISFQYPTLSENAYENHAYIVTFAMNDETDTVSAQKENVSQYAKIQATSVDDPVREGYVFAGWYKDAACTTLWDAQTDAIMSDTILYAGWTGNKTDEAEETDKTDETDQTDSDRVPGDINGDGKVDTSDLVRLMKMITENAQDSNLDMNGDGKVDTNDLIRLMKYLTDPTVEIH